MRTTIRTRALGAVFLVLMLAAVWVTYAVFTKKFTSYDQVTVHASKIGLQLPQRADVKIRGVIVGEVLDYAPTADGADITLGLYRDRVAKIPGDVTASILPKTLFGEKFVSLDVPAGASSAKPIADGDVIERTDLSIEVEEVLSDLYPLLRAVQPADLNTTLNAIATALEGRGEQLGQSLETLDDYLTRLNPELPGLVEDLRLTARVSDTYADVLPEVATILRNTITTTTTLEDREDKLQALFNDVTRLSAVTERFTRDNGDNLVRLADLSASQLELFARYAPGYPCLLGGLVNAGKLQAEAFRGFTLHIVLETLPNQPRGYTADDVPVYGDKRGYHCGALPSPPWSQSNVFTGQPDFVDGLDSPTGKGVSRVGPGWSGDAAGFVGGRDESALLDALLAPGLGVSPTDVPDLGALLVGPMARGAEVSLR
ncbi:MCE family protein [Nocardioides hwasunensis]|uniref:MCE family protein n=1 Tax=Nocardioides hwasunensis TaxID=397258 RepID=A0ABR8MCK9_9ACTN|nr:MCE family protein [Nocardioides hwasunensis]MBD3913871.1 MCE family protein [Nocardioides hwasunensis]